MADNTVIPLGTQDGDTIALDDIGGVKYPRSKITLGADGVNGGDVSSSNPMPVTGTLTGVTTVATVTTVGTVTNVVHVDDNSGSLTIDNAALSVTGGGVEASALRVTIASDSTGVLSIDDNGGSITVDGTVAISGTVTVGSHAVTNAGTFVVQENGAALTSLQLLDDVIGTSHDAAPGKIAVVGGKYSATPPTLDDGDACQLRINVDQALVVCDEGQKATIGSTSETAPATDTATSGLNGRLQRIAQRLTSLIAQIPASLGIKTAAESLSVAPASDAVFAASQNGTWNVTNISGTVSLPTGAATAAKQPALGTAGTASADVITIQGIASMTAVKVDGSAVTQPVSGTFWQATQPVSIAASVTVVNSGTFAVQSTLQAGTAYVGKVRLTDGTTDVDIRDLANSNAVNVSIVDGSGDQITSFGGGTQYTEGDTDATIVGTACMMEVAANTLQPVQGTVADGLLVNLGSNNDVTVTGTVTANIGTVGTLATAANQTTIIGHVDGIEGLLTTIDADTGGIATSAATIAGAVSGNEMQVDVLTMPTVTVTGTVTATISASATTIAKEEDAASANQDVGVPAMAVRKATPANTSGTDGDYEMLQMSAGRLWTSSTIDTALPAGTNAIGKLASNAGVTIGAVEIAAAQTLATVTTVSTVTTCSTVTTLTGGGVAHDGADSGNPVKVGARAAATLSDDTMVANADRTDMVSDLDGALIVRPNFPAGDILTDATSNTDGASTASSVFSATASTRSCVTGFQVFRTDAGTTPIYIDFRDGTGGSVLWRAVLPPNGGANSPAYCGPCLFRTSANTALAYDVSSATNTVYISVSGYKSKV